MLDKIIIIDKYTIKLVYTNRPVFTLYSSTGAAMALLAEFLAPIGKHIESMEAWANTQGDTVKIKLEDV